MNETEVIEIKRRRKLLIASDGFFPRWDGIVRFLSEVVPRLANDYDIIVLAPRFPGDFKKPFDAEIHRFKLLNIDFGDIQFSSIRSKGIKKHVEKADVVFVQSIGTIGIATIKAAKKLNKPVIAFLHLIEWELASKSIKRFKRIVDFLARKIAKHYYNMCSLLICPTDEVMHKFSKNGIKTRKRVVNLGTDTNKFVPTDSKEDAKERLGINPRLRVIGFHGRIAREKDLLTLYRAFRRLEKKYEDIRLMIVGKGVREQEQLFSSEHNIIMTGSQADVLPYLHAMDIYVLPSQTETSSLSTMEAMSCGLPVVTTPVGYIKDYIVERKNGMLFPIGNSTRLYMKLDLLLNDKDLRDKMGRNARITIKKKFSWDATYKKLKEIIDLY